MKDNFFFIFFFFVISSELCYNQEQTITRDYEKMTYSFNVREIIRQTLIDLLYYYCI